MAERIREVNSTSLMGGFITLFWANKGTRNGASRLGTVRPSMGAKPRLAKRSTCTKYRRLISYSRCIRK